MHSDVVRKVIDLGVMVNALPSSVPDVDGAKVLGFGSCRGETLPVGDAPRPESEPGQEPEATDSLFPSHPARTEAGDALLEASFVDGAPGPGSAAIAQMLIEDRRLADIEPPP